MAKITCMSEQFQHFLSELKEAFWGELYGQTKLAWKRFLELESERQRDRFAGWSRYERGQRQAPRYRNGYYLRDFVTRFGTIRRRIARARGKSFLLPALQRFQRRADELALLVREAFLRGISTRQVGRVICQFSLDEYQHKFDELKDALQKGGFDPSFIAFRENEDKEWDVREIIQRMACFLKERWKWTQPTSMYRSKGKALDLYTNDATHGEFRKLYNVVTDVVTLPEFIQAEFSRGDAVKGPKKFGKIRAVKTLKKSFTPPGTHYTTNHVMHLAASLPIAAAFRELLEVKGDSYAWKVDYKLVFKEAAEELYKALLNKVKTAKGVNSLGSDTEYWTQCANIVLRAKDEVLSKKPS